MSNRAQVDSLLESLSELAFKLGLILVGLASAYLLLLVFGGKLTPAAVKANKGIEQVAGIAMLGLTIGAGLAVVASCSKFFSDDSAGLIMTVVGGALHFLAPSGLNAVAPTDIHTSTIYAAILKQISLVGLICLIPGGLLLLKAVGLQVARAFNRSEEERVEKGKPLPKPKSFYANCWSMPQCNEHAKRVCPAWAKRRSCWQVKAGCLCDQDVMRRALIERDIAQGADAAQASKTGTMPKDILTAEQKKQRCRSCTIYAEHQRQKFRLASPIGMAAVIAGFMFIYRPLSGWLYSVLMKTDSVMKLLALKQGHEGSASAQGHTVTTLAMICLAVVLVSVTLKLLEYLIYELQV